MQILNEAGRITQQDWDVVLRILQTKAIVECAYPDKAGPTCMSIPGDLGLPSFAHSGIYTTDVLWGHFQVLFAVVFSGPGTKNWSTPAADFKPEFKEPHC